MFGRYNLEFVYLVLFMSLTATNTSVAQNYSVEFWPEVDIWYRISPNWRLSSFVPITKYNESKNRDLNIYLQVDYAWGHTENFIYSRLVDQEREQLMKIWMVRGGVMKGWSLSENESSYSEDMFFAEIHKRTPIKGEVLLSQRFRMDNRWLGEDNNFSYRFRYRLMVEKEYKYRNHSIVPYLNAEPYWDSRYAKITKIRAIGGVTTSWNSKYFIEGNITYQYDENYVTQNLFALNIILHIFLEKNQNKATELQK